MLRRYMVFPILVALSLFAAACGASGSVPVTGATSAPGSSRGSNSGSYGYGSSATQAPSTKGGAMAAQLAVSQNAQLGSFLVDSKGMTLYVFMKDTQNSKASNCYGQCATIWPPLTTQSTAVAGSSVDASKLGTITRTDGSTQITYNGWPLYYFAKDKQAGDTNGQKVQGIWFVVSPSGDPIKQ